VAWADATPDARVDITGALGVDALPADVTDLAHATATVRMTGAGVPAVLARVCPVDLRRFADGHAVRTSMAQVPTEVLRVDRDGPTYLLSVSRSFGPYFWALLTQAAGELSGDEDEYKRTLRPASQVGIIMTDNVDQARVGG
jgi:heterotetrameric sarcosine oxidase gamma subunit